MKGSTVLKENAFPSIMVSVTYVNGDSTSFEGCNVVEIIDNLMIITKRLTGSEKKHIVVLSNVCELSIE